MDPSGSSQCLRKNSTYSQGGSEQQIKAYHESSACVIVKKLASMKSANSVKEFTPDLTDDEDEETYWFRFPSPGLYLCKETELMFDIKAEGLVSYRTVPWDRGLLRQHGKKPAGPLYDISCELQSVLRLHLPHCDVISTAGGPNLSVAHLHDGRLEFIRPEKTTETHVVINIRELSAFGIIASEDSPTDLVQALVLLFYKPPADSESDHQINVLILPGNVPVRKVLRFRKNLHENETFIEITSHCQLKPKEVYSLSTSPGDDSVQVHPTEAKFDEESYENFLPIFQVTFKEWIGYIKLFLKDDSSKIAWEGRVRLRRPRSPSQFLQDRFLNQKRSEIRRKFIGRVSIPVLNRLLDSLLERGIITAAEMESVQQENTTREGKARVVIDTVRRKGDRAFSEMIQILQEEDPYLCRNLGLIRE